MISTINADVRRSNTESKLQIQGRSEEVGGYGRPISISPYMDVHGDMDMDEKK